MHNVGLGRRGRDLTGSRSRSAGPRRFLPSTLWFSRLPKVGAPIGGQGMRAEPPLSQQPLLLLLLVHGSIRMLGQEG